MRPSPFLLALFALLFWSPLAPADTHAAAGVNLRWARCYGDGGQQNSMFACNTNIGIHRLFGSFVPASDLERVRGFEIVVDLAAAGPDLPLWWQFRNLATCRQNSLDLEPDPVEALVNCAPWNGPRAVGGAISAYQMGLRGPNTARVLAHVTVGATSLVSLGAGQEYFGFILEIDSQKTVGTGACAGCSVPACLVLSGVNLVMESPPSSQRLTGPANLTDSDFVTWQGGGVPDVGGVTGCPAATPARRATWGAVRALYR